MTFSSLATHATISTAIGRKAGNGDVSAEADAMHAVLVRRAKRRSRCGGGAKTSPNASECARVHNGDPFRIGEWKGALETQHPVELELISAVLAEDHHGHSPINPKLRGTSRP